MTRRKFTDKTAHVHCIMPWKLFERMVQRAGKETSDRQVRITPSDVVRYAVEEYLDMWENAPLVTDQKEK